MSVANSGSAIKAASITLKINFINYALENLEIKNEDILFLDTKTIPSNSNLILERYKLFQNSKSNYLIGRTKFIPNNFLQDIHYASSYGNKIYDTVPGTFVKKNFKFITKFFF